MNASSPCDFFGSLQNSCWRGSSPRTAVQRGGADWWRAKKHGHRSSEIEALIWIGYVVLEWWCTYSRLVWNNYWTNVCLFICFFCFFFGGGVCSLLHEIHFCWLDRVDILNYAQITFSTLRTKQPAGVAAERCTIIWALGGLKQAHCQFAPL